MTFQDIEQAWRSRKDQPREMRREFWEDLSGPSRGWFTACRTAVAEDDLQSIAAWLNTADEDKQTCLNFATRYAAVARAHLLCAQAILHAERTGRGPQVPDDDAVLQDMADRVPTLSWPLNWWRDLVYALHPLETASPALASQTLRVLLVDSERPQRPGVVAALTLDLLDGSGELYPAVPMAFAAEWRDDESRAAEQTVWTYLRHTEGVWLPKWDVRWSITRPEAAPLLPLRGGSLGAALALGVAKLCALGGEVLCEGLRTLHIQQLALTATCTASGALEAVTGLEAKLQAVHDSGQVHRVVVSTAQRDIEPYLNEATEWPHVLAAATLQEAVQRLATAQAQTQDAPLACAPEHLLHAARQQLEAAQLALHAGEEAAPQKLRLALHAFGIDLDTPGLVPGFLPINIGVFLGHLLREVCALPQVPETMRHQVTRLLEACYQPSGMAQRRRRVRVCLIAPHDVAEECAAAIAHIQQELPEDRLLGWVRVEVVDWGAPPLVACDIVLVLCWSQMGRVWDRADSASQDVHGQARPADAANQPSLLEAVFQEAEDAARAAGRPRLYVYQRTEIPMIPIDDPQAEAKRTEWEQVRMFCARFRTPEGMPYARYTPYDTPDGFARQWAQHLRRFLADEASAMSRPFITEPENPYKYLDAFQASDARYFRGRLEVQQELCKAVTTSPFVALVGPSGSGKSSLVFAGVVPSLDPQQWCVAICRPRKDPFGELAQTLAPLLYPALDGEQQQAQGDQLKADFTKPAARRHIAESVAPLLHNSPTKRLLLIVDQFEELYTRDLEAQQRHLFLEDLDALVRGQLSCCVLVTLRADVLDHILATDASGVVYKLWNAYQQILLGRMTPQELQRAIIEPAAMVGVEVEDGLAALIIRDLGEEPGYLPLLEVTLHQLFQKREGQWLTHENYLEIGGVMEALANAAEATRLQLLDPELQEVELGQKLEEAELDQRLQAIFSQLVQPDKDLKHTRRIATRAQIGDSLNWKIVQRLATSRLVVTTGRDKSHAETVELKETVEVAHERLFYAWKTLKQWIEDPQEQEFREWQSRLRSSLETWERLKEADSALLHEQPLQEAEGMLARHEQKMADPKETHYIRASLQYRDQQRREQDQLQEKSYLLQHFTIVPLVAGVLGALTRPMFSWFFGSLLDLPGTTISSETAATWWHEAWLKPAFHGFFGTYVGAYFVVFALAQLPRSQEALTPRRVAGLARAGIYWGGVIALLITRGAPDAHASTLPWYQLGAWGYPITGTCWGLGLAGGTYLGNRWGRHSADISHVRSARQWGGLSGTLCFLLLSLLIIGFAFPDPRDQHHLLGSIASAFVAELPDSGNFNFLRRTWGEVFQQSLSVWAVVCCFYWREKRRAAHPNDGRGDGEMPTASLLER